MRGRSHSIRSRLLPSRGGGGQSTCRGQRRSQHSALTAAPELIPIYEFFMTKLLATADENGRRPWHTLPRQRAGPRSMLAGATRARYEFDPGALRGHRLLRPLGQHAKQRLASPRTTRALPWLSGPDSSGRRARWRWCIRGVADWTCISSRSWLVCWCARAGRGRARRCGPSAPPPPRSCAWRTGSSRPAARRWPWSRAASIGARSSISWRAPSPCWSSTPSTSRPCRGARPT